MVIFLIYYFVVGLVIVIYREYIMLECCFFKNFVLLMNILFKFYDCNFKLCVDGVFIWRLNDSDVVFFLKKKEVEKKWCDCFWMFVIEVFGKGFS